MASASQELIRQFESRISNQVSAIVGTLSKTDRNSGSIEDAQLSLLRDHWWIQVSVDGNWIDLDPVSSDGRSAPQKTEPEATYSLDDLPDDLFHQVTVRVVLETSDSSGLHESTVLEHRFRPMDVVGQRIILRHAPLNWPTKLDLSGTQRSAALMRALQTQDEWLPVLSINSNAVKDKSFTRSGRINDSPGAAAANSQTGGLSDSLLGQAFGSNNGAIASAEWIEYEIVAPGVDRWSERRNVFDLLGPAARANVRSRSIAPKVKDNQPAQLLRALALTGETDILLLSFQVSPEFVQYSVQEGLLSQRDALLRLLQAEGTEDVAESIQRIERIPGELYALALARATLSPVRDDVFIDRPNILTFHRQIRPVGNDDVVRVDSIDIVANRVATRGSGAFRIRLTQGVVDTAAEALFLSGCGACGRPQNVSELFAASQTTNWRPIDLANRPVINSMQLGQDTRHRVEDDLKAGFIVIVPEDRVDLDGRRAFGWWRIHPVTGDTLGIMESGEGQAMIEYKTMVKMISAYVGIWSWATCIGRQTKTVLKSATCVVCGAVAGVQAYQTIMTIGTSPLSTIKGVATALGIQWACGLAGFME